MKYLLKNIISRNKNMESKQNTININGVVYKLPSEQNTLSSVLNHLDMVKNGTKRFIKLYNESNEVVKLGTSYLNSAKIEINI